MERSPGRITSAGLMGCNEECLQDHRLQNSRTDNSPCSRPRLALPGFALHCGMFALLIQENRQAASAATPRAKNAVLSSPARRASALAFAQNCEDQLR